MMRRLYAPALLALLAVIAAGCKPSRQAASDPPLTLLDGKTVTLAQLKGKPLVLNFWATWCPPCRMEIPDLQKAYDAYHERVQFLGVTNESESVVKAFVRDHKMTYPIALDETGGVSEAHEVRAIPVTYFFNSDGTVSERLLGARTYRDFEAAIKTLK